MEAPTKAISDKEAALRIIQQLPDDASREDVLRTLSDRLAADANIVSTTSTAPHTDARAVPSDVATSPVRYHLEKRGSVTVLVPDRPVPPISASMVNDLIEEMRREREDRWLGFSNEDAE